MGYISLSQLAELPGALELGQVAAERGQPAIPAALMEATLREGDRSAYDSAQVARADAAVRRIKDAMVQADSLIDGYLAKRYALPLAKSPPLLATWARSITRYMLHGSRLADERSDPIARDYRDAKALLQETSLGKFHLGIEDPTTAQSGIGDFIISPGQKLFGREGRP